MLEGVILKGIGGCHAQGYYFSKPLPANVYLEFISKQQHECREGQG